MKTATLCATLLLPVALTALCCGCQRDEEPEAAADEIVTVKVVRPDKRKLTRTTTQPATVYAYFQAEIHAQVSGYLTELKVDIGDSVDDKQVLGVIDVPEMKKARERQIATIQKLKAGETRAEAQRRLAVAEVVSAEARRKQALAGVVSADAKLLADEAEFQRVKELVAAKSVAGRLLPETKKRRDSSRSTQIAA